VSKYAKDFNWDSVKDQFKRYDDGGLRSAGGGLKNAIGGISQSGTGAGIGGSWNELKNLGNNADGGVGGGLNEFRKANGAGGIEPYYNPNVLRLLEFDKGYKRG
jgi:hypothetical protein